MALSTEAVLALIAILVNLPAAVRGSSDALRIANRLLQAARRVSPEASEQHQLHQDDAAINYSNLRTGVSMADFSDQAHLPHTIGNDDVVVSETGKVGTVYVRVENGRHCLGNCDGEGEAAPRGQSQAALLIYHSIRQCLVLSGDTQRQ
ncbi:hypothetical protein NLU13_8526 [Sarocladium strictum]|uniref:Uncharacterized protein n=1 Tax=Sarocladium strictum TaxID=5046 RepID=A0AA39L587_SARSR|nr:hypothetical protein NLU13_8526 [Sarocladium strictum]